MNKNDSVNNKNDSIMNLTLNDFFVLWYNTIWEVYDIMKTMTLDQIRQDFFKIMGKKNRLVFLSLTCIVIYIFFIKK